MGKASGCLVHARKPTCHSLLPRSVVPTVAVRCLHQPGKENTGYHLHHYFPSFFPFFLPLIFPQTIKSHFLRFFSTSILCFPDTMEWVLNKIDKWLMIWLPSVGNDIGLTRTRYKHSKIAFRASRCTSVATTGTEPFAYSPNPPPPHGTKPAEGTEGGSKEHIV